MLIKKIPKYIFSAVKMVGEGTKFYSESKFYNMYEHFPNILHLISIHLQYIN